MAWRNVVVTKHSKITAKMQHIIVQTDGEVFQFPLSDIGIVLIETTRAVISTYALSQCAKNHIKVISCDEKGMPISEITPYAYNKNRVANLRSQMQWKQSDKDRLWQHVVKQKILHQAAVLERFERPGTEEIKALADEVTTGDPNNREGVAAHMYFPRLYGYEFTRENSENSLNPMLDYGYAIILSEVSRQICAHGYLTEFGIHHCNDKNPFNLACDLMEPFRPFVDARVKQLENDFLKPETKVKLVELMREDIPELNTTVTKLIDRLVRDSLAFLSKGKDLPEFKAVREQK